MIERDLFVGVVAIGVGMVLVLNILLSRKPSRLYTMEILENQFGVRGARIFVLVVGILLMAMGLFLLLQGTNASRNRTPASGTNVSPGFWLDPGGRRGTAAARGATRFT